MLDRRLFAERLMFVPSHLRLILRTAEDDGGVLCLWFSVLFSGVELAIGFPRASSNLVDHFDMISVSCIRDENLA